MDDKHAWLPCIAGEGAFSTERAVEVLDDGKPVSLFADAALVKEIDGKAHVRVSLAGDSTTRPGHKNVLLPGECFENGSPRLTVSSDLLR
jgi:hypothetical protein